MIRSRKRTRNAERGTRNVFGCVSSAPGQRDRKSTRLNSSHPSSSYADCCLKKKGDSYKGYVAHCPQEDFGVIQPTAALSSLPYTPEYSMQALKHFYYDLGNKIWGPFGFADGFSETKNWYAKTHLAIDQGPIVVMIENYRTGLIWKLFMNIPDVQNGLKKLGFESPYFKEKK